MKKILLLVLVVYSSKTQASVVHGPPSLDLHHPISFVGSFGLFFEHQNNSFVSTILSFNTGWVVPLEYQNNHAIKIGSMLERRIYFKEASRNNNLSVSANLSFNLIKEDLYSWGINFRSTYVSFEPEVRINYTIRTTSRVKIEPSIGFLIPFGYEFQRRRTYYNLSPIVQGQINISYRIFDSIY
ncbi:hypothetical protein GYB22_05205 [bacterium]|nr:hypothetical protein [bacterium]